MQWICCLDAKDKHETQQKTQSLMLQFRMSANYIKVLEQQINELEEEIMELKAKLASQQGGQKHSKKELWELYNLNENEI